VHVRDRFEQTHINKTRYHAATFPQNRGQFANGVTGGDFRRGDSSHINSFVALQDDGFKPFREVFGLVFGTHSPKQERQSNSAEQPTAGNFENAVLWPVMIQRGNEQDQPSAHYRQFNNHCSLFRHRVKVACKPKERDQPKKHEQPFKHFQHLHLGPALGGTFVHCWQSDRELNGPISGISGKLVEGCGGIAGAVMFGNDARRWEVDGEPRLRLDASQRQKNLAMSSSRVPSGF
jgi:hypothetical protein